MRDSKNLGAQVVEQIREGMVFDDAWNELENGFEYWLGGHRQVVTWEGPFERNDLVGWLVTSKTDFLKEVNSNDSGNLSSLARLTGKLTSCGVIPGQYVSEWSLASSVLVHEENFAWVVRLLFQGCTQQFLHCFNWSRLMPEIRNKFEPLVSDAPGDPNLDLPFEIESQTKALINSASHENYDYLEDELNNVRSFFQKPPCFQCTGETVNLTAEFPFAKFSQLLTVQPKFREENGQGLLVSLRFPYPSEIEQIVDLAFRLNEAELDSEIPGYFLGSWHLDETGGSTLAFSQFLPHAYLRPNMLFNHMMSFVSRASWADQLLNGSNWEESFNENAAIRGDLIDKVTTNLSNISDEYFDSVEKFKVDGDVIDFYFTKTSDQLGCFSEPIELPDSFFEDLFQYPLFQYGIFNPMGPSWNLLTLAQHEKYDHLLLCNRMLNPFSQCNLALSSFKKEGNFNLIEILESAFKQNGSPEKPLMKCMPTWVAIPSGESDKWADAAFCGLTQTQGPEPIRNCLHYLREYPRQPWDRAAAEMEGVLKDQIEEERKLKFPDFDEWWNIVTDENHLKIEVKNMIPAWNGAIDFQMRAGEELVSRMFPNLMKVGDLFKAIGKTGMGDQIITRFIEPKD